MKPAERQHRWTNLTDKEQNRLFKEITETHTSINGPPPDRVIIFHHIGIELKFDWRCLIKLLYL